MLRSFAYAVSVLHRSGAQADKNSCESSESVARVGPRVCRESRSAMALVSVHTKVLGVLSVDDLSGQGTLFRARGSEVGPSGPIRTDWSVKGPVQKPKIRRPRSII